MVAVPGDGTLPHWGVNSLSASTEDQELEEQDLDIDHASGVGLGRLPQEPPPWEDELASRIQAMAAAERALVLEAIHLSLQREDMRGADTTDMHKLLSSVDLDLRQPLGKNSFRLYGLLLRESPAETLRKHLPGLLELSHQDAQKREGIALAVGIASTSHLEEVWAVLEQLGQTRFQRFGSTVSGCQEATGDIAATSATAAATATTCTQPEPEPHGKWAVGTTLLCYGQMATRAKARILPWVDNIVSRMVYYFSYCSDDNVLKTSFLSAVIMLAKALRWERSAQNYKFTQIPELIQCLLYILQKEPNFLATLRRQKIMLVILVLSNLRPYLKPMVKSRVLRTCLQSLYPLPPMEMLEIGLPLLEPVPDVRMLYNKCVLALDLLLRHFISENKTMDELCFLLQHTETWLRSGKSHERKRAVQSIFLLLQHVVEKLTLTERTTPAMLGHQVGLLTLLWRDRDKDTQHHSQYSVYFLLQLLVKQRGPAAQSVYLKKLRELEARDYKEWEMKLYNLVKAFDENLTVAQHTQLVLTLLRGLCSADHLCSGLAAKLLFIVFETPGLKLEQVAEVLHGLFQELPAIIFRDVQVVVTKTMTALGSQHTQETIEVILSLGPPTDRQVLTLWKSLGSSSMLARRVLTELYRKMMLRPPTELVWHSSQSEFVSLLALSTVYELLYMPEYKPPVRWAFAGILLGLLTELHYLFELGCVKGISDNLEDSLEPQPLSPSRKCLEALKGLFWTTSYWEVFACIKLLGGWELFQHQDTYTQGVTLLARAMAHFDCEIRAVLGQAIVSLKSSEERDNVVAILIITEFLSHHELTRYVSRKTVSGFLNQGLKNPSELVRAASLQGLGSSLLCPQKVGLLQSQLVMLLNSLLRPELREPLGLLQALGYTLRFLGPHARGAVRLKVAQHMLPLFDDDRDEVREEAIFLFGDLVCSSCWRPDPALKGLAFQGVVPLIFHLADPCPAVAAKAKLSFLRCAIVLKWEFRKQLFSALAWGRGLGAQNYVFLHMMESSFGSHHQFLLQASRYLGSPDRSTRLLAMTFMERVLQEYSSELCRNLKEEDLGILWKYLEVLKEDPDPVSHKLYLGLVEGLLELSSHVT